MKSFKPNVEKGIPLPPDIRTKKGPNKSIRIIWPFAEMEIGDSFLIPEGVDGQVAHKAVWKTKYDGRMPESYEFEIRVTEDGKRMWRTN